MIISDAHILLAPYNAVYIDIAKVASSSLKSAFADLLGLGLKGVEGNPHKIDFPHPDGLDISAERFYPNHTSFAFVRHPLDRLVSCYRDKILGEVREFTELSERGIAHCLSGYDEFSAGMSFGGFVQAVASIPDDRADEHFRSQHTFVTNNEGAIAVDYVGRFETLDADFQRIAQRIGFPPGHQLPRLQAAPDGVDFRAFYSCETHKCACERYATDIDLFQFSC